MHEVGIAQQILRVIQAAVRDHGGGRVHSARLRIGELSGVEVETLKFALQVCSQGTCAEGMALEVVRTEARLRCRRCSGEWQYGMELMCCPFCGSKEIQIHGGDDLCVESLEVEAPCA